MSIDTTKGIAGLKGALRYVRAYRDQVFVVKLGGEMLADARALDSIAAQVSLLSSLGIRVVVVHGGGPQATALSRRLGHEPRIVGGRRVTDDDPSPETATVLHRTIDGVRADMEGLRYNTAVAKLTELNNHLTKAYADGGVPRAVAEPLLLMLAPLAPHISEELWSKRLEAAGVMWRSIHTEAWPAFDPALVVADTIELPVQVNGKLRDLVPMTPGLPPDEIERLVMARPKVQANLEGLSVVKVVHVPGRLVNIVVR